MWQIWKIIKEDYKFFTYFVCKLEICLLYIEADTHVIIRSSFEDGVIKSKAEQLRLDILNCRLGVS
jgi:hypothetical protein